MGILSQYFVCCIYNIICYGHKKSISSQLLLITHQLVAVAASVDYKYSYHRYNHVFPWAHIALMTMNSFICN